MKGDIRGNNVIDIEVNKVDALTIWLSSEMIDWNNNVRVLINHTVPNSYPRVGRKLQPNLEVLFEDYYTRGDRRMLFLNKLVFTDIRNR